MFYFFCRKFFFLSLVIFLSKNAGNSALSEHYVRVVKLANGSEVIFQREAESNFAYESFYNENKKLIWKKIFQFNDKNEIIQCSIEEEKKEENIFKGGELKSFK